MISDIIRTHIRIHIPGVYVRLVERQDGSQAKASYGLCVAVGQEGRAIVGPGRIWNRNGYCAYKCHRSLLIDLNAQGVGVAVCVGVGSRRGIAAVDSKGVAL